MSNCNKIIDGTWAYSCYNLKSHLQMPATLSVTSSLHNEHNLVTKGFTNYRNDTIGNVHDKITLISR